MLTGWIPVADGESGIRHIVERLAALRDYYGARPEIRRAAMTIAAAMLEDDDRGNVERLAQFVRLAVKYQKDPLNAEFVQSPDVMILDITRRGWTYGDCDDHVLLFASLAEALGVRTMIAGVKLYGDTYNHVIAVPVMHDGEALEVDLCAKRGETPTYPEKILA